MVTGTGSSILALCMAASLCGAHAQLLGDPQRTDIGVGTRAMAMGNAAVALPPDPSALFWNPAAMALARQRQLQLSFGGFGPWMRATFRPGQTEFETEEKVQRIRLGNVALLRPIETSRGGLAFGLGFQNPYVFDALLEYGGSYGSSEGSVTVNNSYRVLGHLDFWTGGFGVMIADKVSLGLAVSAVTGGETAALTFRKHTGGRIVDTLNHAYDDLVERDYVGYDIRVGLVYRSRGGSTLGLRIVLPSTIAFEECGSEVLPAEGSRWDYALRGWLKSYYTGAVGIAHDFPFGAVSAEINARAPHPDAYGTMAQRHWAIGGKAGVEIPLLVESLKIRGGYGWHNHAPNPYLVVYDAPTASAPTVKPDSPLGEHLVSTGLAFTPGDRVRLEVSYAHRLVMLETEDILFEEHHFQRALASLTVEY